MSNAARHILVVDDDPILRELVVHELEQEGFLCKEASSGPEAWKIIENDHVFCLIADLAMEDSSGVDLIDKVKQDERFKDLSVIIASGVLDITPQRAQEMGAIKLFIKPFLIEDLLECIRSLS